MLNLLVYFEIVHECPLVILSTLRSQKEDNPAFNLKTASRSARLRRSSRDHKPSLRIVYLDNPTFSVQATGIPVD